MPSKILLAVGPETHLAKEAIAAFTKSARAAAPNIELIELALRGPNASMRVIEALSPSLLAAESLVVITDRATKSAADLASSGADVETPDDATEVLVDLMPSLPAEIWLALDLANSRGHKALIDAARESGCQEVECERPSPRTITTFITKEFARHKRSATPEAIEALRLAFGEDLPALANAVAQLVSDEPENPVTLDSVRLYHGGLADLPWFKVSEAVWSGSPARVMTMVREAFDRDSTAALPMIAALASDIRLMARVAGLPRGMSDAEAGKLLGAHPFRVKNARQQLPRWSPTVLADAILNLAELDSLVKGGASGTGLEATSRQYLVESAFLRVAAGRG
jgi:DNA polymerase-3 subunit delta